jgi:hypothetical protein
MLGLKLWSTLATVAIGAVMAVTGIESGPKTGAVLQPFEPQHVTGSDAGTATCPVCKYGDLPAVQVWVNGSPTADAAKIASNLDKQMTELNGQKLKFKSFMIFKSEEGKKIEGALQTMAKNNHLGSIALAWLPAGSDALGEYSINPQAHTTILVYKNRQVKDKFIDLKTDEAGLKSLDAAIHRIVK